MGRFRPCTPGAVWLTATAEITLHGKTGRACRRLRTAEADVPARRRLLQNTYYEAAMCLREPPAWGSLSGVRPTKLTTRALLEGRTPAEAEKLLRTRYHVSPERSRLCVEASEATVQAAQLLRPQDVSVYVGIPFCPTRCAYCSFVSSSIERFSGLLEPYLDALVREIAHTGDLLRASGRTVRTPYIGGGTPTTLSSAQLRRLMEALRTHIDLTELVEYTVEGGRPDTLDAEKLETIASMGCGRMSINPQTMNDAVLARVGRRHTAAQTVAAYEAARAAGYDAVNMDLIAGLPGDDPKSFADSLRQVLALAPENVTVHTLALKKGADLYAGRMELPSADDVAQMLAGAEASLRAAGYTPYYLYRQKYMSGSFENIGLVPPGHGRTLQHLYDGGDAFHRVARRRGHDEDQPARRPSGALPQSQIPAAVSRAHRRRSGSEGRGVPPAVRHGKEIYGHFIFQCDDRDHGRGHARLL